MKKRGRNDIKQVVEPVNATWRRKSIYSHEVSFARPHEVYTGSVLSKLEFPGLFSSDLFYTSGIINTYSLLAKVIMSLFFISYSILLVSLLAFIKVPLREFKSLTK